MLSPYYLHTISAQFLHIMETKYFPSNKAICLMKIENYLVFQDLIIPRQGIQ